MSDYDDAFGPWVNIVRICSTLGLGLAGFPAAGAGVDLVVALIGMEDGQTRLLREIKNDTRLLREGDFATAKLMLREANRIGSSDSRYSTFLEKSADMLYKAHSLAESVQEKSIIEFHLALVWYSLKSEKDGQHWIEQSAISADQALNELVDIMHKYPERLALKVIDDRKGEGGWNVSSSSMIIPVKWVVPAAAVMAVYMCLVPPVPLIGVGLAAKFWQMQDARLSRLREYLKFYNSVEALNSHAHLQPLPSPLVILSLEEAEVDPDAEEVPEARSIFSGHIPGYTHRTFMLTRYGLRQSSASPLEP